MLMFEMQIPVYMPSEQEALIRLQGSFLLRSDAELCSVLMKLCHTFPDRLLARIKLHLEHSESKSFSFML